MRICSYKTEYVRYGCNSSRHWNNNRFDCYRICSPFGWVYIPSARTTMTPTLSKDISDVENFQRVGISSVGMYRKMNKQIEKQSTKFVKYMVSVVQTIEGNTKQTTSNKKSREDGK
ncbi:MAG: hypothetical protein IPK31_12450 [Chitinophagaceae bacterium]|nr:hypothetical protein [Chitinophagaceae bacterium]